MKTDILNKNGTISSYGLACGYVQRKESDKGTKTLFIEHSHIHVQKFDKRTLYREVWEVFSPGELTKARKFYNSIKL